MRAGSEGGVQLDPHTIFTTLLALFCGLLGWLGRELWQAVEALREDLSKLEIKIGTDYVRYDRLQDALKPVLDALADIRDRLDHKQDK